MTEVASAYVTLLPSAKGFAKGIDGQISGDVGRSGKAAGTKYAQGMGGVVSRSAKGIFAPLLAVGAGIKALDFLGDSVAEGREALKVAALTRQVIKTTGKAANVSAKQVGKLSESISEKVGIDDEAIQSGANLLLTFKNVRNEVGKGNAVFDRATKAAVNLSAAGFGDLAGASKQLGKALNDPVKGVTALARSGVTFTDQQKEQIKTLVESGKTLQAQKIILGEVESQVGGAAAAQATAGDKLRVSFGNLQEKVGKALIPALDDLAVFMTDKGIPAAERFVKFFKSDVVPILEQTGDVIGGIAKGFGSLPEGLKKAILIGGASAAVGLKAKNMFGGAGNSLGIPLKGGAVPVFVTNPGGLAGGPGGVTKPGQAMPPAVLPGGLKGTPVVPKIPVLFAFPNELPPIGGIEQLSKAYKILSTELGNANMSTGDLDQALGNLIRNNPELAFAKMSEAAKKSGTNIDALAGPLLNTRVALQQNREEATRKVVPWFDGMKQSVIGSKKEVHALGDKVREVGNLKPTIKVDADTSAAQAKINALRAQIAAQFRNDLASAIDAANPFGGAPKGTKKDLKGVERAVAAGAAAGTAQGNAGRGAFVSQRRRGR